MNLFDSIRKKYSGEKISAPDAQRQAEFIAWGPVVFQISRIMVKSGILEMLRDSPDGLTVNEISQKTALSVYAVKILTEASLSIGTVLVNPETDRLSLSKTGWFLLNDPATKVNLDFVHDVNYQGLFYLEDALKKGRPEGLKCLGNWPTIYEGLSKLPENVLQSWLAFDHFYSDNSFEKALEIVFANRPKQLMDVGGNTGRFALQCAAHDSDVNVTIADLPGQIGMMKENVAGKKGAERIHGEAVDILDETSCLPDGNWDAIWMSQFLDCFSESQISMILTKAKSVMKKDTTLFIMETFWDRQRFEPATFCLTMTSVYFTVMANGNSKMYHSDDILRLIDGAGLETVAIHDGLGQGHTILEVRIKK